MVRSPSDWPWSSYLATSGQTETPKLLAVDWILGQFDAQRESATRAYRRFVHQARGVEVWDCLRAGCQLGSDSLVESIRPLLLNPPLDQNVLRRERDAARSTPGELFANVSDRSPEIPAFTEPSGFIITGFKRLPIISAFTSRRLALSHNNKLLSLERKALPP
jgi:putative transposase